MRARADGKSVELGFGLHRFYFSGFNLVAQKIGINTELSETTEHTDKAKKKRLNAETRRPQRRARKDKSATESERTLRRKKKKEN